MAEIADVSVKWLERQMPGFMESIGIRATGEITQELDTMYPPASKPGESPHKRTGSLQAGVSHVESNDGDEYATTITSRRAEGNPMVPTFLEFGTKKMAARPYMRPVRNHGERIVNAAASKLGSAGVSFATDY